MSSAPAAPRRLLASSAVAERSGWRGGLRAALRRWRRPVLIGALLALIAAGVGVAAVGLPGGGAGPALRTFVLRAGPYELGGYDVRYGRVWIPTAHVDGAIVAMHARVVDAAGRHIPIRRIMLHHVVIGDSGTPARPRRDLSCNSDSQRFYGTGEENQSLRLPAGYGYPIRAPDRWRMTYMLMNHRGAPDRGWIQYRVTVDVRHRLTPVRPYWLSVVPCSGDPQYTVPGGGRPGSRSVRSIDWRVPADGRIVAAGGHLHGGAENLTLTQPGCRGRTLLATSPLYGLPSNPVYHVLPVLHEPGPIYADWFESPSGLPILRGQILRLNSIYDGRWPHVRVMGIMHVYVAPARGPSPRCAPRPADARELPAPFPGRRRPPHVPVPLTGLTAAGLAHPISRPPGATVVLPGGARVRVRNFSYSYRNLSVPAGSTVVWSFEDPSKHNTTVADGPRGFASRSLPRDSRFAYKFDVPGTYRLFCSLHPVQMTERVIVRPRR
jgi:plastocyanin